MSAKHGQSEGCSRNVTIRVGLALSADRRLPLELHFLYTAVSPERQPGMRTRQREATDGYGLTRPGYGP